MLVISPLGVEALCLYVLRSVHTRRQVAATCRGDTLERQIASCVLENFAKIFVAATSRTDSVWFDFLRLVAATKFCCGDKDFHKNSPVPARSDLSLRRIASPCCCNLSPSVYRPLELLKHIRPRRAKRRTFHETFNKFFPSNQVKLMSY